jgi:MoaA/NifB/PqqE/SkfB family radical SAM enzyme
MKLEDIGFYTLTNDRAINASHISVLSRCELVLTSKCNFQCPYCRGVGGPNMSYNDAYKIVKIWGSEGLRNIRFSGGEPTLWKGIFKLTKFAKDLNIKRIAISTNGSSHQEIYEELLYYGVNDFSISLDACCAEDSEYMSGGIKGVFNTIVENIKWISQKVYTTVGIVLTHNNIKNINNIIKLADELGVHDIRIIPAAQNGKKLSSIYIDNDIIQKYPILRYRVKNLQIGKPVRGLSYSDSHKCGLVLDDICINHKMHFPCIIYMRELGNPIGLINKHMRIERKTWYENHDTYYDPICRNNCLDVCIEYNNKFEMFH